ncbi:hypothetical protein HYFRA_00004125, partial [Hymenoscyphus fraxineus]
MLKRISTFEGTRNPKVIIGILLAIIFMLSFGGFLMEMPAVRLYEDIICHHYYNGLEGEAHIGFDEPIDEGMCKGNVVQNELNFLFGTLHFISPIPRLLTTIPYGALADRVGRKPIFILAIVGFILSGICDILIVSFWKVLPLRLIWLSPLFTFIGGGEAVAAMIFYAIACDITTETARANVFLLGGCGALASTLVAPTVASFLMAVSPMLPLFVGLATMICGASFTFFMPETLHLRLSATTGQLTKSLPPEQSDVHRKPKPKFRQSTSYMSLKSNITGFLDRTYEAIKVISSVRMQVLLFTFIALPFCYQSVGLSIRYVSNRFSWKLRETMLLLSLRALVNIIILLAFVPLISKLLTKQFGFTSQGKDLLLARFSIIMFIIGSLIIATSPTIGLTIAGMIIWTVGTGFDSFIRSLITALVDKEHIARLYSIITVVETLGALVAGPSLNYSYSVGLEKGDGWSGLPFYILALVCLFASFGVWSYGWYGSNGNFGRRTFDYEPVPFGEEYLDDLEEAEGLGEDRIML